MRHIVDQEEQKWTREKRAAIPAFDEWCLRREAHGKDRIRLWCMMQYTDDPCILAVGADLMHRVIKAWHWLTSGMGSMMAIPEKRTLGTSARWLGIKFLVI